LNPQLFFSGYGYCPHVLGEFDSESGKKNKSALQSGKKYSCNESDNVWTRPEWKKNKSATNPITCGRVNPDIFLSDDVNSVSSLSPNNKPIRRHNVEGEQSKFPATTSLFGACFEDILVHRSLGY